MLHAQSGRHGAQGLEFVAWTRSKGDDDRIHEPQIPVLAHNIYTINWGVSTRNSKIVFHF